MEGAFQRSFLIVTAVLVVKHLHVQKGSPADSVRHVPRDGHQYWVVVQSAEETIATISLRLEAHVQLYVRMQMQMHTHVNTQMHLHMHTHTRVWTHTCSRSRI